MSEIFWVISVPMTITLYTNVVAELFYSSSPTTWFGSYLSWKSEIKIPKGQSSERFSPHGGGIIMCAQEKISCMLVDNRKNIYILQNETINVKLLAIVAVRLG